jgi:hypothetical protein
MNLRPYLPSATFFVMAGSLVLSVLLVIGAQYATAPKEGALAPSETTQPASDWQQALADVQTQTGVQAPQPPNPEMVRSMLAGSASPNLTTAIGRSILVNLGSENAQGLGQDAPTQDKLVAQAVEQINAAASSTTYTAADLAVVDPTTASLKAYGNAAMAVLLGHPEASAQAAYQALGQAVDTGQTSALDALPAIGTGYAAVARDLRAVPVPQTLVPLHLELLNNYAAMAATFPDMRALGGDPLRGMAGLQRYSALMDETARVLTSIAQVLAKDGILFNKDEPGTNWNGLLSS